MPQTTPPPVPKPKAEIDLRVDTNRDGALTAADDAGEDQWDATKGAVFLANLDDDSARCPKTGTDATLWKCNDAADELINGKDDLEDFAKISILPWVDAPDDATAKLTIDDASTTKVKIFRAVADGHVLFDLETALTAAELKKGVELLIEATDVVRDRALWTGVVDLTLTASGSVTSEDKVKLRVAPVISFHHLLRAETIYATRLVHGSEESEPFLTTLGAAVTAADVPGGLEEIATDDQWTQDFFETGYMSMPKKGGAQHVLQVAYRSANQARGGNDTLRGAGKFVFTTFRGKDRVGLQQYSSKAKSEMDSLNSFGNFETVPPYTLGDQSYPLGRVLRGSTKTWYPDPSFTKMIDAQMVQPVIEIDTSWLAVGHVDETMSFVKADTERGWVLLVNDAMLAKKMLQDASAAGHGAVKLFVGKSWGSDRFGNLDPAEIAIDALLADQDIMAESAASAAEVDAQLTKIKKETGLTDAEIIRVPYLHQSTFGASVAYQPGTVNGVYLSDTVFASPDPHGPVIDGKDIMKVHLESALQPLGITVKWVEEWDLYHIQMGEAHCGSNALRETPSVKWWETGR